MNGRVVKAHKSSYPNPVEFNAGDRLAVGLLDTEYPGWVRVTTADRNEGWAPVEYVELLEEAGRGSASADYCARELEVNPGEKLRIESTLCGWHYATNAQGQSGWVPGECVEIRE